MTLPESDITVHYVHSRYNSEHVEAVADILNAHPGVSHNYLRDGLYNIWFTITTHDSINIESEIQRLARESQIADWLLLPTLHTFKIGFTIDMNGPASGLVNQNKPTSNNSEDPTPLNKDFIRALQEDLPLKSRPFKGAAEVLGISEQAIIELLREYLQNGRIRRIAAVLRPVKAGYLSNVLVAWATLTDEHTKSVGNYAASLRAVSHCYQRPSSPQWPYTVYTMIHGHTAGECEAAIADISGYTHTTSYCKLTTIKEFKKVRVIYY